MRAEQDIQVWEQRKRPNRQGLIRGRIAGVKPHPAWTKTGSSVQHRTRAAERCKANKGRTEPTQPSRTFTGFQTATEKGHLMLFFCHSKKTQNKRKEPEKLICRGKAGQRLKFTLLKHQTEKLTDNVPRRTVIRQGEGSAGFCLPALQHHE